MRTKWRYSAVRDLTHIRDYIVERDPKAAEAVVDRVLRSVDRLATFPKPGRLGQASGTREVIVPGLPYIVVYTDTDTDIDIIAVFHGAQHRDE